MNDAERFEQIFLSQVVRPGADKLLEWLKSTDFFTAPASTRFHGAYPGGLVKHSLNVYYALLGNSICAACIRRRHRPSWRCCMTCARRTTMPGNILTIP